MKKIFTLIAAVMMAVGASAENMALKITTTGTKSAQWDSQVIVNFPTPLKAEKYTMTMELKGDAVDEQEGQWGPVALQFVFQDNNSQNRDQWGGPADLQYGANFRTTADWSDLKDCGGNPVTTDGKFPYSRVALNLGRLGGSVYIDNMKFIDENGVEAFCITFDTPEEQALVFANGGNPEIEFIDDSAPVIDDYMLKIDLEGEPKANNYESQVLISLPEPLKVGSHYSIYASFKCTAEKAVLGAVLEDTKSENKDQWGNSADIQYSNNIDVTPEWGQKGALWGYQDADGKWQAGSDGKHPYNRILLNVGLTSGTVWVDNIKIIENETNEVTVIDFKDGIAGIAENRSYHGHVKASKAASDCPTFDTPTAIKTVNTDVENNAMYNIAGQRVQNAKGIVIKNGKKFVF